MGEAYRECLNFSTATGSASLCSRSLVNRVGNMNHLTTYLLLAECKVRTASYGPSFFLPFMAQAQSARAMKTRKEKRGSITWCTDRANEANKMFIIWFC